MDNSALVDEELLHKVVQYYVPPPVQHISKDEKIHFGEIHELHLEYEKILMIDRLEEFTSLTRLDLNNNHIDMIEGLDCLSNLKWLNLSYNSIDKIEGLESLEKLEMLNFSNNRISVIENMDTLKNLTHFYISKNRLGQLDNVLYLRKFKNLFTINLFGNPLSKEDGYKIFIGAHFPNLVCLDFRVFDEKIKKEGSIKYRYALEELKSKEMKREELQMQQSDEAEQSQDTFVEYLNGSHLFKSMLKDDPEAETLYCVPEVADVLKTYEHEMVELCMELFETGLTEQKRRETEVNSFFSGHNKAVTDYQQKASQVLANFEQQHKEGILELQQLSDPDLLKVKNNHCKDEINQLSNTLIAMEFELVGQLEVIIKKLDVTISDMVGNLSESAQGIFTQCRDLDDNYYEKLQGTAITLESVAKADNLDEDLPEYVKMLLADRDTVLDALAVAHDNHLLKINERETQLVTHANAWKVALIKGIQDKELKRTRIRMSDIHTYLDRMCEQLEELNERNL